LAVQGAEATTGRISFEATVICVLPAGICSEGLLSLIWVCTELVPWLSMNTAIPSLGDLRT
jgi:hypothetical protein